MTLTIDAGLVWQPSNIFRTSVVSGYAMVYTVATLMGRAAACAVGRDETWTKLVLFTFRCVTRGMRTGRSIGISAIGW